jgi:hypothetical protein
MYNASSNPQRGFYSQYATKKEEEEEIDHSRFSNGQIPKIYATL